MRKITAILFFISVLTFTFSCRKDSIDTKDSIRLSFSTDSVLFDTVFTTFGSTTKRLKIYNPSNSPINISSISVGNGTNSQFRINVDGVSGNIHKDVFLGGKDSLFIFAEVTIDPNNVLSPFVVNDNINFITNGTQQSITLAAWGQNAHYFVANKSVGGIPISYLDRKNSDTDLDSTWVNDKPYVIYGGYLTLDGDDKLTIEAGVRVHFHNGAGLWVFENGNINVNGTKDEPVTFQGTRLEHAYQDVSGQWDRIWINNNNNGLDHVFNYAIIKNGFIGIQAEPNPFILYSGYSPGKLRLNNCQIHNNSVAGILAKNFRITDTNSVISNAGQHSLLVQGDGEYEFYHTTFANYWSESTRKTPSIFLQNAYINRDGSTVATNLTSIDFYNCIIDGDQEIEFDTEVISTGVINFTLNNCVLKTSNDVSASNYVNTVLNPTANLFVDKSLHDYHLVAGSPAINAGDATITVTTDHDGNPRSDGSPDIGAFEN
jgi:hypothetical protein